MPDIPRMLAGSAKYMNDAVPQLIAGCKDKDHNVRQCSVYGLGILAQQHHEAFRASLQGALMAILGIVTAPGARFDTSMRHLGSTEAPCMEEKLHRPMRRVLRLAEMMWR